jgi:hypothetical protein
MPIRQIQTQAQADALRERWPGASSGRQWVIGYIADWNNEACHIMDTIQRQLPAKRKALERWWTVDPANIPG